MSVVRCFKQVSIITSNNAFTPAHFPSRIGIVRVTSYSDRVFASVSNRFLTEPLPGNGKASGSRRAVTNVSVNTCQSAAKTSPGRCSFAPFPDNI